MGVYFALSPAFVKFALEAKICGILISAHKINMREETMAGTISIDFGAKTGAVKPLHGVNNAPIRVRDGARLDEYRKAGIPFMRTHDTAGMWGGAHYVDIPNVFPDFDADENDPKSYRFAYTDSLMKALEKNDVV